MEDFYNFLTKNTDITSFESVKALADGLKTKKEMVVDGLHHDENWNGRAFAWGSQKLAFWVSEQVTHKNTRLLLLVRGDLVPEEVLKQRFKSISANTNRRQNIDVVDRKLANGDVVLKLNLESNESAISIEFADIADEGEGRRKLSVPFTAFILAKNEQDISDELLEFWNRSHLFDASKGIARFIGEDNDSVSDYFVSIMEETGS
ncbi:hypothetical protein [Idiomarina sp.]|uniref:hypothetical protein n=1 Tax=Idiomarina sp. TaxID=1874361 RepID=UPI0026124976|nr:hypothetical protein [Idiomarina sp.]